MPGGIQAANIIIMITIISTANHMNIQNITGTIVLSNNDILKSAFFLKGLESHDIIIIRHHYCCYCSHTIVDYLVLGH